MIDILLLLFFQLADEDGFYNAGEDSDMQELVQNDQADAVLGQDHEISLCNDNQTGIITQYSLINAYITILCFQ